MPIVYQSPKPLILMAKTKVIMAKSIKGALLEFVPIACHCSLKMGIGFDVDSNSTWADIDSYLISFILLKVDVLRNTILKVKPSLGTLTT